MAKAEPQQERWTPEHSEELYAMSAWGNGYFRINANGHMEVVPRPRTHAEQAVDVSDLIRDLGRRGVTTPVLLRFNGILEDRVSHLFGCFQNSIREYGFQGRYRGVYPIKVNQQRHVVEALLQAGRPYHLGVEVGSKPELLAVLALVDDPEAMLICNGYKDRAFLQTALLAQRIGRNPVVVIERFRELEELLEVADEWQVEPVIGLRAKLAARGSGRWEASSGDRSKFGLSPTEMMRAVQLLKDRDRLSCLQLLHFHVGSQITAIANVKKALREAARIYVELQALGAPLGLFDVGGGLGVDYDGSRTNFQVSLNYTDQEYANDVVWTIQDACDQADIPHPDIISESGRALVAHHSVLVANVTGSNVWHDRPPPRDPGEDAPGPLTGLWHGYQSLTRKNMREVYHDLKALKDEALTLFNHGILTLDQRAQADEIAWATFWKLRRLLEGMSEVPEEFEGLERNLADIYYCNFSLFQSLPDCWAIRHMFPVVPIERHKSRPTRQAVLADITCDSDGKLDQFIDLRDVRHSLPVHALRGRERYHLAFFLVGAYQEILGDPHNLFGDTNAVHVDVGPDGSYEIQHLVEGDRICEVLSYVEYHKQDLVERLRRATERAVKDGRMDFEGAAELRRLYEQGIESSTYPLD